MFGISMDLTHRRRRRLWTASIVSQLPFKKKKINKRTLVSFTLPMPAHQRIAIAIQKFSNIQQILFVRIFQFLFDHGNFEGLACRRFPAGGGASELAGAALWIDLLHIQTNKPLHNFWIFNQSSCQEFFNFIGSRTLLVGISPPQYCQEFLNSYLIMENSTWNLTAAGSASEL